MVQFAKEAYGNLKEVFSRKESIESGGTPKDCSVYMKRNGKGEFVYQKPPENSYAIHTWMRLGGIAIVIGLALLCIVALLPLVQSAYYC